MIPIGVQVDTDENHGLFLHEQLAHLYTENTGEALNITSNENIMENNYMFVVMELNRH